MAGGGLVLAANSLLIGNNYLVRAAGLGAGEVALVRGLLQLAVFSFLLGLARRSGHSSAQSAEQTKQPADHCKQCCSAAAATPRQPGIFAAGGKSRRPGCVREWLLVLLYGLLTSSASFSCVSAIPLMPIGDLIVVCMSTPVFSVILDKLVLKRPLTLLSVTLCVLIGDHQQLVLPHLHVVHLQLIWQCSEIFSWSTPSC